MGYKVEVTTRHLVCQGQVEIFLELLKNYIVLKLKSNFCDMTYFLLTLC